MKLSRWFISEAVLLAAQTIATLGILSAASPAVLVTPVLHASGQLQLTSTLGVPAGTPIVWSLYPQVGAVSAAGMYTAPVSNGLYTAPATITAQQNVTLMVTSEVDPTKRASALITLTRSQINLPIEVLGPAGTTTTVSFNIPSGTNLSGAILSMTIHALRYQTEASLKVNNSAWLAINDSNVTLLGTASAYGGIGGGFHTLQMTLPLPHGDLQTGLNTLTFRFNGTDGAVSQFRVLAFNIENSSGNSLISSGSFVEEDPSKWQPPSSNASDIAAGRELWYHASLTDPLSNGAAPIHAHCTDCHAQDGRDLKYFNYSNLSIRTRSVFHGLSAQQGDQIASYIRSLNTPSPGRPWNPPYQPGPGLDSNPVSEWAAGAGVDAVLGSNEAVLSTLFPSGVQAGFFSPADNLNTRETPIALELPDWNGWLPHVHPVDAWPDFPTSGFFTQYGKIRSELKPGDPAAYANVLGQFAAWGAAEQLFMGPKTNGNLPTATSATTHNAEVYSTLQWAMVKTWELNQEFGLEAMGRVPFPNPHDDARAWYSGYPFLTSPNMLHIPSVAPTGLLNGSVSTRMYLAFVWYQTQLILNHNNERGNSPIDFGYTYQFIKGLSSDSQPQSGLLSLWMAKGIQAENNGAGPNKVGVGWNWIGADISRAVSPGYRTIWVATDDGTRAAIMSGMASGWLSEVKQFTPQQFWAGTVVSTRLPVHGQPDSSNFEDRVWYMIPQFRFRGVSQTTINQMAAWAQTIWIDADWAATATATCVTDTADPTFARCSTEQ